MRQSSMFWVGIATLLCAGLMACSGDTQQESRPVSTDTSTGEPIGQQEASFQDEEGPVGVRNYTRVDATVACAGATPPEAMAELRSRGFTTVINFRTVAENGATVNAGRVAAEAAGLKYIHIPFREPSAEVAETFLAAVGDPNNQPAFIHCGSANRVGAMWLIKRVKQDGYTVDNALAEAEAIGLSSAGLREFALDYVGAGN